MIVSSFVEANHRARVSSRQRCVEDRSRAGVEAGRV
jgi:hypothetical protein